MSKYKAVRTGKYASKKEAKVAMDLQLRQRAGEISGLREQVPFVLVPGRNKVRPITYIADFTYAENGMPVVADAKGVKTPVYRLKAKMMYLMLGITVEEL